MNLKDKTKNQHFIPQVEQRLNSFNKHEKDKNQKIYSFSLIDRESHSIRLDSINGFKISNTLSLNDVFSFDVLHAEEDRYNFERLFNIYETDIKKNTESLLSKLPTRNADVKPEIINLFLSKLLNFIRNPYSIKKVLNTFPQLKNLHPTNPVHYKNFERIIKGKKPHQVYLCNQLGISEQEYTEWLSVIFLLLTRLEDGSLNFFEQLVKNLFENRDTFAMVIIYTYEEKACLLSDRGYSIPLPEGKHTAWDFNLYSNGFIRYIFGDIESLAPVNATLDMIEKFKSHHKQVDVISRHDDLNALSQYNKNVIYQCHSRVFNSSRECFII